MQYRFSTADFFVRFKVARIAKRHGVKATTRKRRLVEYVVTAENPTRAFVAELLDEFDLRILSKRTDALQRWTIVWPHEVL